MVSHSLHPLGKVGFAKPGIEGERCALQTRCFRYPRICSEEAAALSQLQHLFGICNQLRLCFLDLCCADVVSLCKIRSEAPEVVP